MNRFRFLQTGDIHVGRGRGSWGEEVSLARSGKLFDELYAVAHEQKCHALLITGDIFDRKSVTNAERELVSHKLTLHSVKMPTYIIPGNHDLRTKSNSNLDYLAEITEKSDEIPNLHIAFADRESIWPAPVGDMPEGLFIVGAPGPLSEDQTWVESFATKAALASKRYIFMGHGTIAYCMRNDALWRPKDKDDKGISLGAAALSQNIIWWAYGDIHKRQKLPTLPRGANGWYAGSPIQMDFGETPNRGALVVACDHDKKRGWFYKGRRFIRLDDRGFAPLITVTKEEEIDSLPDEALLRLAKGLVLPSSRHEQVVTTLKVVEDRSTPEAAVKAAQGQVEGEGEVEVLEAFDPLLADLGAVEDDVLAALPHADDETIRGEARKVVGLAVDRYRERTFVS